MPVFFTSLLPQFGASFAALVGARARLRRADARRGSRSSRAPARRCVSRRRPAGARRRHRRRARRARAFASRPSAGRVSAMLEIVAAGMRFVARWEDELAPQTVAAFKAILPLDDRIIHCRWSGESNWIPWGDRDFGHRPRERDVLPAPGRARALPRRPERDRAALPVRLLLVRVEGGPAVGEPLRHGRRGRRSSCPSSAGSPSGKARSRSRSARCVCRIRLLLIGSDALPRRPRQSTPSSCRCHDPTWLRRAARHERAAREADSRGRRRRRRPSATEARPRARRTRRGPRRSARAASGGGRADCV